MSEILSVVDVQLAMTVGGYAVGQVMETVAKHRIGDNQQALMPAYGDSAVEPNASKSLKDKITPTLRRGVTTLALMGGLTGYLLGSALDKPADKPAQPRVLTMAVDHSYEAGAGHYIPAINALTAEVGANHQLEVGTLVAHNGSFSAVDAAKISKDQPYGPDTMSDTTAAAIDSAFNSFAHNATSNTQNPSAEVLVITDGHPIGQVDSVVQHAKENSGIQINVVNSGPEISKTAKELKLIASKTNGKYWRLSAKNEAQVANAIKQQVQPATRVHPESRNSSAEDALLYAAIASLMITGIYFTRRLNETAVS